MSIVDIILKNIEKGEQTQRQLINQYNNVKDSEKITEQEREAIISAIEKQLRARFPAAAKKKFGARDEEARQILSKIDNDIRKDFDLSDNVLKSGVKSGGFMINGTRFVDVYISYKNRDGLGAALALLQETVDDELRISSRIYQTGGQHGGVIEENEVGLDELEVIVAKYREYLKKCVSGN